MHRTCMVLGQPSQELTDVVVSRREMSLFCLVYTATSLSYILCGMPLLLPVLWLQTSARIL